MENKKTFIIEICDTQNQTWQGNVEWVDKQRKQPFCSMLELLRLMGSVVETDRENDSE